MSVVMAWVRNAVMAASGWESKVSSGAAQDGARDLAELVAGQRGPVQLVVCSAEIYPSDLYRRATSGEGKGGEETGQQTHLAAEGRRQADHSTHRPVSLTTHDDAEMQHGHAKTCIAVVQVTGF
jgi:hypothetical protein